MPSIAQLIGELQTKAIRLRGREVIVRAMPAGRIDLLKQAFPKPVPPLKFNPLKGKNADPEVAEWDAEYIRSDAAHWEKISAMMAAMAIDLDGPDGSSVSAIADEKGMKAWGEYAYTQLMNYLTPAEIKKIADTQRELVLGKMEEEAAKNS